MKSKFKPFNSIAGTLMVSTVTVMAAAAVNADTGPFGATELQGGYMQIAGKGEGSCGEGKCGAKDTGKAKEGSCGEAKCGAEKGKESSSGEEQSADDKTKGKEGSCGEGKCGGKKS